MERSDTDVKGDVQRQSVNSIMTIRHTKALPNPLILIDTQRSGRLFIYRFAIIWQLKVRKSGKERSRHLLGAGMDV